MSRIGDIRNVIVGLGGRSDVTYYADGPSRSFGSTGVLYKVERYSDGLTDEKREKAVLQLAKLPGVEKAYLSRRMSIPGYGYCCGEGGHIKVHYTNTA